MSQYTIKGDGSLEAKTPESLPTGSAPKGTVFSPDGRSAYVANNSSFWISQYSIGADGTLKPKRPATVDAPYGAESIAMSPDGHELFAATSSENGVIAQFRVAPDTGLLTPSDPPTVPAGPRAVGLAIDPAGRNAYVANEVADGTVTQFRLADGVLSPRTPAAVAAGSYPSGVAVGLDGVASLRAHLLLQPTSPGFRNTRSLPAAGSRRCRLRRR